jgi:hypothetical protein
MCRDCCAFLVVMATAGDLSHCSNERMSAGFTAINIMSNICNLLPRVASRTSGMHLPDSVNLLDHIRLVVQGHIGELLQVVT